MLALEGIRILDFSRAGPGPFCTMILGDLGADVIKIEAPMSIGQREAGLRRVVTEKREFILQSMNRNKKSIEINLQAEEGRSIIYRLAEKADVVVEGFRPGTTERLGIDYPAIREINPRIVYCSITGYGHDGPYRDLPGHDINYLAFSGLLDLIGEEGGRPVVPQNVISDYGGGGMSAAVGILAALMARSQTGTGQFIDISMADSVISLLPFTICDYFRSERRPKRGETSLTGAYPYQGVYETEDKKYIALGCLEPWFWENFCLAIGKKEFIPFHHEADHRIRPPEGPEWEEVSSCLRQIFLSRSRDDWFDFLKGKDIPVAKVNTLDEVFADPHFKHREMVIETLDPEHGKIRQGGIAIKLSDTPGLVRRLPPAPGQHTKEILKTLGYEESAVLELHERGIV